MKKLEQLRKRLKDKKILILGFGREGRSTYEFLRKLLTKKELAVTDQKLGVDYLDGLREYDIIFKSPGIPAKLGPIKEAKKGGVEIISQTQLFFELCPGVIVGVTGTKGKSTVASLIHHTLELSGRKSVLLGNIGRPPLDYLSDNKNKIFVFELSSHQLFDLNKSPHIAVLLNISREHLDYYESFEQYVQAKANITRFQKAKDYFVYNNDQEIVSEVASKSKAKTLGVSRAQRPGSVCYLENGTIICRANGLKEKIVNREKVLLEGEFNLLNVMAAVAATKALGVSSQDIRQAVRNFKPLKYRLENVGTFKGITFYDDTLATIPEATIAALETLGEKVDTLILGGTDRGQDFRELTQAILEKKVKNLVLLPTTGKRIWEEIEKAAAKKPNAFFVNDMKTAVKKCFEQTRLGRICLMSTASASFGLFRDYEERSKLFRKYIRYFAKQKS